MALSAFHKKSSPPFDEAPEELPVLVLRRQSYSNATTRAGRQQRRRAQADRGSDKDVLRQRGLDAGGMDARSDVKCSKRRGPLRSSETGAQD